MNDDKLIELVNIGLYKINHSQLMMLYRYVTKGKETLSGSCTECAKRNAIRKILNYYNKL